MGRLRKSDMDFRYVDGTALGYTISFDSFVSSTTFTKGLLTPSFTYERWNGSSFDTVTVRSYVFVATSSAVYAFRATSMVRENSKQVRGTGMISLNDQDYIGE